MAKLPRISGEEMVRFLEREGFALIRIRDSHHVLQHGSLHTTVPVHGNRDLKIGTLRKVLRDVELSPTEFERRLRGQ